MRTRIRATAVLGLPAVVICCSLLSAMLAVPSAEAALSPSAYRVSALCSAPPPGYAGCFGLKLVAKVPLSVPGARTLRRPVRSTSHAVTPSITEFKEPFKESLTPAELRGAYNVNGTPPTSTQTIAIVDAYDDPTAEADLGHYDQQFGLPACTKGNGCFRKINQEGKESPLPPSNTESEEPEAGWALEIATDIEVAHAVCQNCHIVLVEAKSAAFSDLEVAEETAAKPISAGGVVGATEISDSWGGPESGGDSPAFDHPGVVITVAAGDFGYRDWDAPKAEERGLVDYPASSPHVVAVGGTRLIQNQGIWQSETVWNDGEQNKKGERGGAGAGGGGCSESLTAPPWQQSVSDWKLVGCGEHRAVADISADADPYTGVAVYDSTPILEGSEEVKGWNVLGGTSVASPVIASVFALAGGSHGVEYPAQTLYENLAASPSSLHDVVTGSNGACLKPFNEETLKSGCTTEEQGANSCASQFICVAHAGYDGPTGVGTPNGITAFQPLSEEAKKNFEERKAKEKQVEEQKRKEKIEEERRKSPSEGTTGVQPNPNTTTSGGALTTATAPPTGSIQSPIVPLISGLALTRTAIAALNHGRPQASRVAFVFTLSAAARVRATLAKQLDSHGRRRWQTLPYSLTSAARRGRNRRRLSSRNPLTPGRYRLTLTPQHGGPRSITFQVT